MNRVLRDPRFIIGVFVAALLSFIALFGRGLCPNDPLAVDFYSILLLPGGNFPLGTDNLGRCIFSRLLAGAGVTLASALFVETFIFTFGLALGLLTGYFEGPADAAGLLLTDTMLAFPSIILALVVAGFLGPGLENLLIAMCCVHWVGHARVARSLTRRTREKTFVISSRAAGSGHIKIIFRHILPHILPQLLVYSTLNISSVLISLSSMSFLGLGVRPPQPEWSAMLNEARSYMNTNPLALVASIVCILLAIMGFQLIGEALRDGLEVRASHLGLEKRARVKANAVRT
jgi:peptide/nickel transport system permease protein